MGESLLVALSHYKPSPGRDPKEDFLTESFRWFLDQSPELTRAFLGRINQELSDDDQFELPPSVEEVNWSTQVTLGRKRPDMMARWSGMTVIFEHKDDATIQPQQLKNYRSAFRAVHGNAEYCLVLIARTKFDHDHQSQEDKADACLSWSDVYEVIRSVAENNGTGDGALLEDFEELLRYRGFGPTDPVKYESVLYYPVARSLPESMKDILSPLAGTTNWPVSGTHSVKLTTSWGRIGIQFDLDDSDVMWAPGLFFGTVLDGTDHRVAHRHQGELCLQLIVDFDKELHSHYRESSVYRRFKEKLAKEVGRSHDWSFYSHCDDPELGRKSPNLYHPLYMERPFLDLITDGQVGTDQRDRFRDFAADALQMVSNAGLTALIEDCRQAVRLNCSGHPEDRDA